MQLAPPNMYKLKDEDEYRNAVNEMEALFEAEPDPQSEDGITLGGLIDSVEEYEARTRPRIIGWVCAVCSRSYSPMVDLCGPCNAKAAQRPLTVEQRNQQLYQDHLDHMIQCDANFQGRGC